MTRIAVERTLCVVCGRFISPPDIARDAVREFEGLPCHLSCFRRVSPAYNGRNSRTRGDREPRVSKRRRRYRGAYLGAAVLVLLFLPTASAFTVTIPEVAPVGGQWPVVIRTEQSEIVQLYLLDPYGTIIDFRETAPLNGTLSTWLNAPNLEANFLLHAKGYNASGPTREFYVPLRTFCGSECSDARNLALQREFNNRLITGILWTGGGLVLAALMLRTAFLWSKERPVFWAIRTPRIFPLKDYQVRERPEYVRVDEERRAKLREGREAFARMGQYAQEGRRMTAHENRMWGLTSNVGWKRADAMAFQAFTDSREARRQYADAAKRLRQLVRRPVVDRWGVSWDVFHPRKKTGEEAAAYTTLPGGDE
jgi:hypothetical protein